MSMVLNGCYVGLQVRSEADVGRGGGGFWAWLDVGRWARQLHRLRLAVQDWAERFWQVLVFVAAWFFWLFCQRLRAALPAYCIMPYSDGCISYTWAVTA
jgi:hypothetical protein